MKKIEIISNMKEIIMKKITKSMNINIEKNINEK